MNLIFKKPDFEKLKQSRDEKTLVRLLNSKNAQFREQAARALGDIQAQSSIKELVKVLVDDNPDVRTAVIQSLTIMRWQPITSEERIAWFFARGHPDEAASLQDLDVPMLILLFTSAKEETTRILAAQALSYRYNDDAIEALIHVLGLSESKEWIGQVQAAEQALVKIGKPAVPKLQEIVNTDTGILSQRLFEAGQKAQPSGASMPMPIFVPRATYHIILGHVERMKQKAGDIIKTILAGS